MSTKTLMSVEEYLHTTFDGADREYLDGEVVERNMGNKSHGRTQARLIHWFMVREDRSGIFTVPELRHRITSSRYRIPDVAVFASEPEEDVPSTPPLVAIEILSPSDTIGYIVPKLAEYRQWGVRHIWLADPDNRKLFTYGDAGLHEATELSLPEHGIVLTLADVFGA